uniref:membralin-like n=1 Tax=Styela clava TaxID=7725 RepID=UPI00193A8262|nr:membralin-like [Styela clava]XP_039258293.1 membralin-like [Styela clava]
MENSNGSSVSATHSNDSASNPADSNDFTNNPGTSITPTPPSPGANQTTRNTNNRQRHRNRRGGSGVNRNNLRSREGFFMHYLFITLSVRYATYFKPTVRRMIEFFTLIKAIIMLMILIYIHVTFVKDSGKCLEHVEDIWPRSGVLKVQVEGNTSVPPFQFFFARADPDNWATSLETDPYQAVFKYSVQFGKDGIPTIGKFTRTTPNMPLKRARKLFGVKENLQCPLFNMTQFMRDEHREMLKKRFSETVPNVQFLHAEEKEDVPKWILIDPSVSDTIAELKMLQMQEHSGFNVGPQPVREYYAIEYSAEFGYLRLSATTRHKLGIPVLVVTLDPLRDSCFGEGMKRWMLDTFFGYDDLVMSSIKQLAEKDNKQGGGYLRNLVTGEHYKFITLWVSHASYLLAFAVMLVFTLVVTMLLRYSYHQIFVFMVELLHILDTDATPVFPAAPMLTIILALVGTEEIMTEFFHDSTLAFYVILSIWIADQFDAICMHTVISRRHWVRFFFLYHFAFYAYHYRFNGQFSELALFTSWLFIQHSMFYFLHHYEIPAIQRQIRLRQILFQNNMQGNPPNSPPDGTNEAPLPTENTEMDNNDTHNTPAASDGAGDAAQNDIPSTSDVNQNDSTVHIGISSTPNFQAPTAPYDSLNLTDNIISAISPEDIELENSLYGHENSLKESDAVELWDDFTNVLNEETIAERNIEHNSVGVAKYCSLIMMLFFAIISLILLFSVTIFMLNQGKFGARSVNFDRVAEIVR